MKATKTAIKIVLAVVMAFILQYLCIGFLSGIIIQDTYSRVIVPRYRYVSYDELRTCPTDISMGSYSWFDDYMENDDLIELRRYMRENDLYISPGEYKLARVKSFEDLKSRLKFTHADRIPEVAYERYLALYS